jgi:DNA-binding transcriptional ArsR family regulator
VSSLHDLRAVAHPTRTRILALLRERPSITATECAGILHLTPKTCSYHLQTLAAGGLIREVPTAGRNRPWELVPDASTPAPPPAPPSVRTRREEAILEGAAHAVLDMPPEWSDAAVVHMRVASMTAAEVTAWCEEVERVTSRHVRRAAVPDAEGRQPVNLIFVGYPTDVDAREP